MKTFAIGCGLIFWLIHGAAADDTNTFPVLAAKRGTFTNAAIRSVSGGYAIVIYDGGGQRIPISELPEAVQKRYATNASQTNIATASRQNAMSPDEYIQWQKEHAPELLLRRVNSEINVTQSQITLLQQKASEIAAFANNSQMPTRLSTITPVTADMLLSPGAPRPGRSALEAYNDKLRDLQNLKEQLEQVVLARQRAQFDRGN